MRTKTQERPKTDLMIRLNALPESNFRWRDMHGKHWKIEDMETRHVFHVVRMIWDHTMPEEFQTDFNRRYLFPDTYTQEYMALAVRLMLPAVIVRNDLEPYMEYWLQHMRDTILGRARQVTFVRLLGNMDGRFKGTGKPD
jgi:hypothetical protein